MIYTFVNSIIKRNENLVTLAFDYHVAGKILPNTYMLDLDKIIENAVKIKAKADIYNIDLFFMTKQFGRNPYIAKKLIDIGYSGAVVVDFEEALIMMEHNIPIKNIGHLVQIPKILIKRILEYGVEFITVYSIDILKQINTIAKELGYIQKVLIKAISKNDTLYSGQLGGFYADELDKLILELSNLSNIKISGLTSFPCFLFNDDTGNIEPTTNIKTLNYFKVYLEKHNVYISELNLPSVTSIGNIEAIANLNGTQAEPGHALIGTTPNINSEEIPAILYVTEVSHNFDGKAYCYGGGYYRRGHLENAIIGKSIKDSQIVKALPPSNDSIDYYIGLDENILPTTTVLMAFRTQIFVTRSNVMIIEGLSTNTPKIEGVYTSLGRKL